jgi:tRNA (guanine-N7-)-methyltransferase
LCGHIERALRVFTDNSLHNVSINFPDPWWKNKHFERRLLNHSLSSLLNLKLKNEGFISIKTDIIFLIYKQISNLLLHGNFIIVNNKMGKEFNNLFQNLSLRERFCRNFDIDIYKVVLKKILL